MKICVIGTGYVGLVAGAGLADFGNDVVCIDKDQDRINLLNGGGNPIYEIGLSDLMKRNIEKGRLKFSSDLGQAVENSLVVFLTVGTPEGNNGDPDLSDMLDVASEIGRYINDYKVIAIKSTVPVGTHKLISEKIRSVTNADFDIVSNPEFLREGSAVNDFLLPNRIVIGISSDKAKEIMKEVYRGLYLIETPMIITDNNTAEIIKYAANCFLAAKISFINEMAQLCDYFGADVVTVAKAVGMDGRIGPKFLHPSPGFGGSCLPKDIAALNSIGEKAGVDMQIPKAIKKINIRQRELVVEKARKLLGTLNGKKIGLLGLAFKSNTDDIRNSPSQYIAKMLLAQKANITAYDPLASDNFKKIFPQIAYADNPYSACNDADIAILMTEWNEFRELDLVRLKKAMKGDALLDTRNIYLPEQARKAGFRYIGFGRS